MKKQLIVLILAVVLLILFLFTFSFYSSSISAKVKSYELSPILDPLGRPFLHPIGSIEADLQLQDAYDILREERNKEVN